MKIGYLKAGTIIASVVLLLGTFGTASAKDKWTVLGQKTIKPRIQAGDHGRRGEDVEGGHQEDEDLGRGR